MAEKSGNDGKDMAFDDFLLSYQKGAEDQKRHTGDVGNRFVSSDFTPEIFSTEGPYFGMQIAASSVQPVAGGMIVCVS
ncbi:hypothetical protein LCGC14_2346460 [marine sediment metagenome]|uniref:Uncharacterized protein n=1 Tax=marine sediment metagenome TaxID=412755 RepID=A0A0F9F5L5_9ZZZZ